MIQRSEEWFQARLGKATASRFADVMATTKNGGEYAVRKNYRTQLLLERMTGVSAEGYSSQAMEWGVETEPLAKLAYELKTGNTVNECGFIQHKTLEAGASPDGLLGSDGVLEIKCPNTANHIETLRANKVPSQYVWQVQGQMWITGAKFCDFVSYDPRMPENAQIVVIRAERDNDLIEQLEGGVKSFLDELERDIKFVEEFK
jgi:putative phage-type endonuclease